MLYQVFYLLGMIGLVHEFRNFITPMRSLVLITMTKQIKTLKEEEVETVSKTYLFQILPYIIWSFIGLCTSQWLLFVILLAMGFMKGKLLAKARIRQDVRGQLTVIRWDALASACCIALIIFRGLMS